MEKFTGSSTPRKPTNDKWNTYHFEDVFPIEHGGFSNVMLVCRGVFNWLNHELPELPRILRFIPAIPPKSWHSGELPKWEFRRKRDRSLQIWTFLMDSWAPVSVAGCGGT